MLKREKINGEDVLVHYLDSKMQPCSPKMATMVKMRFPDGKIVFASAVEEPSEIPGKTVSPSSGKARTDRNLSKPMKVRGRNLK